MAVSQNMTIGQIREMVENPGQPIRQPAVSILTIDTADRRIFDADGFRVDTTSPNQIYINRQQTLMNGYITRIALTELNIEWNAPNVIESGACKNNTLLFERGSTTDGPVVDSYTLSVPERFYTPNELAAYIQYKLNLDAVFGASNWYCLYNSNQNAGFAIGRPTTGVFFRIRPQNQNSRDDLCNLMGFTTMPSQFYYAIVGSYAYTPYFDIVSSQLTKKQNVNDSGTSNTTGRNLLARIYLNQSGFTERSDLTEVTLNPTPTPPGPPQNAKTPIIGCRPFALHVEFQSPKQIYWDTKEFVNAIDLTLYDYKGRVLYAQNQGAASVRTSAGNVFAVAGDSSEFQLTLQVTET